MRGLWSSALAMVAFVAASAAAVFAQPPMPAAQSEGTTLSPDRSLMFSPAEVAALYKALGHAAPSLEEKAPEKAAPVPEKLQTTPNIYISAVVDYGDGSWTVWANGMRISPDSQPTDFKVVRVADDKVDILVEGVQVTKLRLRANQTWRSAENDVVEGIIP